MLKAETGRNIRKLSESSGQTLYFVRLRSRSRAVRPAALISARLIQTMTGRSSPVRGDDALLLPDLEDFPELEELPDLEEPPDFEELPGLAELPESEGDPFPLSSGVSCFFSFSVLRVCFSPQRAHVRSSVPSRVSVAFFVTVQGPQSCPRATGASVTFSCGEKASLLNTAVYLVSPAASQEAGLVTS